MLTKSPCSQLVHEDRQDMYWIKNCILIEIPGLGLARVNGPQSGDDLHRCL